MKYIFTMCTFFILISCNKKQEIVEAPIGQEQPIIQEKELLNNFSYEDVAKYTISTIMGKSPKIMSVDKKNDLYIVSYIRKSDKQKFTYKIKFESDTVIWANIDGRWRDNPLDEKIKFQEIGKKLKIKTLYSDGSLGTEEFSK